MTLHASRVLQPGLPWLLALLLWLPPLSGAQPAPARSAPAAPERGAPAAAAPGRAADYIVAVVNSDPITNNEVRERTDRVLEQNRDQANVPPRAQLMRDVLERLIIEKIQVQMARESGIKVDDFAVDQAELSVAQQNGVSVEQLRQQLAREGTTVERFRRELRNQLSMLRVREREVDSRVKVSDLDVDQYLADLEKNAPAAARQINLGHILVLVPENASEATVQERRARADEALAKLRAGAEFATVAHEYSDAPEGRNGGALGLRPVDRYPELFVNATQQAAIGSLVGPLRSPAGFHILKVLERSSTGVPTTAVQTHARHILLRVGAGVTEAQAAARLAELRQRIVSGQASFETLAREYSQDASSKQGGDLGWAFPGRFVPEFEQALNALRPGQVSEPVVTRFGVHLIELVERRQAQLTQREQRDLVRSAVREKKLDEAYANWLRDARAQAYVEYREAPQ